MCIYTENVRGVSLMACLKMEEFLNNVHVNHVNRGVLKSQRQMCNIPQIAPPRYVWTLLAKVNQTFTQVIDIHTMYNYIHVHGDYELICT